MAQHGGLVLDKTAQFHSELDYKVGEGGGGGKTKDFSKAILVLLFYLAPLKLFCKFESSFCEFSVIKLFSFKSLCVLLQVSARLFDIMSGQSEVDHPLCEDCTDALLSMLDEQLHMAEKELHDYKHFLEDMDNFQDKEEDEKELDQELARLHIEEEKLLKELEAVESEREKIRIENKKLDKAEQNLKMEEDKYWRDYCLHKKALSEFQDEQMR